MRHLLVIYIFIFLGCSSNEKKISEIKTTSLPKKIEQPEPKKSKSKSITTKKTTRKKSDKLAKKNNTSAEQSIQKKERTAKEYKTFHQEAFAYCKKKRMNKEYYFLLDFSIPSGKNRFFIVDFNTDSIIKRRIVTHGVCDVFEENFDPYSNVKFSDQPNSHCSSKGKYKIGKRAFSNWGVNVKYWIKGMEKSNKSAEKRVVVLHSWDLVSDHEIYPDHSPLSWGCPAVSNNFMLELDAILKASRRPVLLWIID